MEVCLLGPKGNFDSTIGKGTQRYAHELWKNLSGARLRGIKTEKEEIGIGISPAARKVSFTISVPFKSLSRYDIVHLPAPIPIRPPFMGDALLVTTVTEFINIGPEHPFARATAESNRRKGIPFGERIRGAITSRCIKQALGSDFLFAISSLVKEEAISKGFQKDRIYVTNLGIDERFLRRIKVKPGGKFIVGYLGALNVRKNVAFAINSFRKIESASMEFKIYGSKNLEYQRLAEMSHDDRRIKFMGFAPENRIVDVYDSFDVFVYPILYTGFELEILEAQARGLPVITYKKATIPKEVRRYCIEAKDEDHMAQIIERIRDNGYDQRQRRKALEYARGFTWKRCAMETAKAYRDIYASR